MPTAEKLKVTPSKLERAILCPGSVRKTKDVPWSDSPAAARGRALHDAMALLFQVGTKAWEKIATTIPKNPHCKAEDIKVLEAAWTWGNELMPDDPDVRVLIEQPLELQFLNLDGGKPDAIFVSPRFRQAVVIDWKFGSGVVEDPEANWQMRSYGAGTIANLRDPLFTAKLGKKWNGPLELEGIEAAIIQPSAFRKDDSVRSHAWQRPELKELSKAITAGVMRAKAPDSPLIPGPVQCRWCEGKTTCSAYAGWKANNDELKAAAETTALNSISRSGTPVSVSPAEPLELPMIVINGETIALAEEKKAEALTVKVVDQGTAQAAGILSKDIRSLYNLIDKNREKVKKPILDLGRMIDAAAKQAMTPLGDAANHLDAQVSTWMRAQEEIAAKARAEEDRKRREAEEAEQAAARAEQAKRDEAAAAIRAAEEAEARAASLKTKAAREKAEQEAADLRLKAQKATQDALAEQGRADQAAAAARAAEASEAAIQDPGKVAGYRTTAVTTWEIPDFSLIPAQLQMVVLTPNKAVIDSMVKTGTLNEKNHGTWLTITRGQGTARSR